jgi:hypothetical protein
MPLARCPSTSCAVTRLLPRVIARCIRALDPAPLRASRLLPHRPRDSTAYTHVLAWFQCTRRTDRVVPISPGEGDPSADLVSPLSSARLGRWGRFLCFGRERSLPSNSPRPRQRNGASQLANLTPPRAWPHRAPIWSLPPHRADKAKVTISASNSPLDHHASNWLH